MEKEDVSVDVEVKTDEPPPEVGGRRSAVGGRSSPPDVGVVGAVTLQADPAEQERLAAASGAMDDTLASRRNLPTAAAIGGDDASRTTRDPTLVEALCRLDDLRTAIIVGVSDRLRVDLALAARAAAPRPREGVYWVACAVGFVAGFGAALIVVSILK